jgi:peptide/nickel transport system permease protein
MKRVFCRWSSWALFSLVIVSVFSSYVYPDPGFETASPFAKPFWLDSTLPLTMELEVSSSSSEVTFEWEWAAPKIVSGQGECSGLLWITPSGQIALFEQQNDFSDGDSVPFSFDTRDIPFKRNLGISPFANAAETLFPSKGKYSLVMSGEGYAKVHIGGGRYGLLGTDHRGRDVLALFVSGIEVSLIIGLSATIIAALLGLSLGLISGYAGGVTDTIIMRIVDILLSIPTLPILLVMAGIWGKGLWQIVVVLSIFSWMGTARTVRAQTMTLRDSPFVESLRSIGCTRSYILFRHLVPEVMPLLLANIVLGVPGAILAEAGISFLGLSDPRIISWGRMLHEAQGFGAFTAGAWWMLLPPGVGISFICIVFMDIGKYMEELMDPRLLHAGKKTR